MIGTGIGFGVSGFVMNNGLRPVLDLYFSQEKSLTALAGPTPSFSRASKGWAFNASGVLTEHAINAPRFDHVYDGSAWVSKGLLIEEQRTNLCGYSEGWPTGWSNSDITISSNNTAAPDGNTTADKITETSTTASHRSYLTSGIGFSATTYTYSIFAKASSGVGRITITLGGASYTNSLYARFNLNDGTTSGLTATGSVSAGSASVVNVGNGWYRCIITGTFPAATFWPEVSLWDGSASGASPSYAGNTNNAVFVWGAQVEAASFASSYIPNLAGGTTTRSADVCQITGSDFSGIWNATEGTMIVEFDQLALPSLSAEETFIYNVVDVADANQCLLRGEPAGTIRHRIASATAIQAQFTATATGATVMRHAGAFKANDFASSFNGATASTDGAGDMPISPTAMYLGRYGLSGSRHINGHIARICYYNSRLPNATLERLST